MLSVFGTLRNSAIAVDDKRLATGCSTTTFGHLDEDLRRELYYRCANWCYDDFRDAYKEESRTVDDDDD